MRTKTTKRILPIRTMIALTAALTLSAPPLTPPAAAQCPGLFQLDWVGTNGVEGGKALEEPIRNKITLSSTGICGLAGTLLDAASDIDPTDNTFIVYPWGGYDALVNVVNPRHFSSENGRVGGPYNESGRSITAMPDDTWVHCGNFQIDASGEYCASYAPFEDDQPSCIHGTPGDSGTWLSSFDGRRRVGWTILFIGEGWVASKDVKALPEGRILLTGFITETVDLDPGPGEAWFTSVDESRDAFLLCLDAQGNYEWAVIVGNWRQDEGEHLATDPDGNIYWLGRFSQTVDFDPGPGVDEHTSISGSDMFISKYTPDGVYQWTRTVNTNESHLGYTIDASADGRLLIGGYFKDRVDFDPTEGVDEHRSNGDRDCFVSAWTTEGEYLWTRAWGGPGWDAGTARFAPDGGIVIAGGFNETVDFDSGPGVDLRTSQGEMDAYLGNLSSAGDFIWVKTFGGPSHCSVGRFAVDQNNGDVWLDGLFMGTVDFDPGPGEAIRTSVGERDLFLMKMRCAGGGCAELTGHSATGRSGKAQSTVATTLPAGKAALRLADDAGHTIATQKATIAPDGAASATFKRLPRGMYRLTVTQLKNAEGNKVCRGEFLERRVEVR